MAGHPDSGYIDLAEVFRRVQDEMLAQLSVGGMFEHPVSHGNATEQQWLALLNNYLPKIYRASPAFIVNAEGQRSEQIDIAIYDAIYSPPLFSHPSGVHIPVESVYAVFEVKPGLSGAQLRYAAAKAESVRKLNTRRSHLVMAGILATRSAWSAKTFDAQLRVALKGMKRDQRIDLGCALDSGSFEHDRKIHISGRDEALIFFTLRLIDRLNSLGPAPPADLMKYVSGLKSFQREH